MNSHREDQHDIPWWLLGDEQCGFCLQQYVLEAEYRCEHCDDAVCLNCVVEITETSSILCPTCAEARAGDANSD